MRFAAVLAVILATTTAVHADKKIQGMAPGFQKEASSCQIEVRGLARVITGTTELVATLQGSEHDAVAADLAALTAANATVTSYCTEVEGMAKFLADNAAAAYKSVEKEIDTRDNAVRKLRKDAKKAIADTTPITRKLIPRLKRTPAPDPTVTKVAPTEFPSKRKVVLPKLGTGTWSVSGSAASDSAGYTDKLVQASVETYRFDKRACEEVRKTLGTNDPVADLAVPADAEALGVEWSVRYTKQKPVTTVLQMCVERGMGGVLATATVIPAKHKTLDADLTKLMIAMIAAQLEAKP